MKFGSDFFKIFNFIIAIVRLFAEIFGDDESKKLVVDSKTRTKDSNENNAC